MLSKLTKKSGFICLVGLSAALSYSPIDASGLFNNPNSILESFCEYETNRQTIIYVDQSVVSVSDEDWFRDILNRITYTPAERVSVRIISDSNSRSTEVWSACHPSLTSEQYSSARQRDNVFRRGIDRQLQDASSAFNNFKMTALSYALLNNTRSETPAYTLNTFPKKSIVEALYYDSSSFRLNGMTSRIIIFSNMVENSELFSPSSHSSDGFDPYALARSASSRFPVNFNNSEVYVYGVGYTHNIGTLDRSLRKFWGMWMLKSNAYLSSFDRQLHLPEYTKPISTFSYRGVLRQIDGPSVASRLRLSYTTDGTLTNSWLGVSEMRFPLKGQKICNGDSCIITAEIVYADENNNFLRAGDILKLSGTTKLTGHVGSEDELQITPDGNKFELPVLFEVDSSLSF